ncbi:superoxide dismutase [Cu-Zn]-like isoform X2 [Ixodes scapularis]|nr:superoxide dismutase [Cu-Zn]-like isoform X2 [Ixodes scapularis]
MPSSTHGAGGGGSALFGGIITALFLLPSATAIEHRAVCHTPRVYSPDSPSNVSMTLFFVQENIEHPVMINGEIVGLTPGDHGLHVHSFGDLTNGCTSTGTHFNPMHKHHGAPEDRERHVGDLGNINADVTGKARVYISDSMISLVGHHDIIGRALVVHALPDDLGRGGTDESKATGSSGSRLACCIVGFQSGTGWPSPNSRLLFLMFSALIVFFCRHGA